MGGLLTSQKSEAWHIPLSEIARGVEMVLLAKTTVETLKDREVEQGVRKAEIKRREKKKRSIEWEWSKITKN